MPLAAWNLFLGISYYSVKSSTTISIEALISVNFRFLNFINIGSTCVVYALTARLFREEFRALFRCQWLRNAIRREQHSPIFLVSRRVAPALS
jgi:hypothetical protein